jgi:hypothetical protein
VPERACFEKNCGIIEQQGSPGWPRYGKPARPSLRQKVGARKTIFPRNKGKLPRRSCKTMHQFVIEEDFLMLRNVSPSQYGSASP